MEFLMTYGWAILAVMIAVAALTYFGVFKTDVYIPDSCILEPGLTCPGFVMDSSSVKIVLQNNFGETITIDKLEVIKNGVVSCSKIESKKLKNNDKVIFTISNCNNGEEGQTFDGEISITYTKISGLTHTTKGSIISKISTQASAASSSICQTAEDEGLCDALDIAFGEGYKALCCSDEGFCCS